MTELNPPPSALPSRLSLDQILRYGKVVYTHNPTAPNQIYIIAQIHSIERDERVEFSAQTPKAQAEIFRLAGHIISSGEANLLLSEGRYIQKDYYVENTRLRDPRFAWLKVPNTATDKGLEQNIALLLEQGIDSDALLIATFPNLDVQGAEDEKVGELLPEITRMAEGGVLTQQLFEHLIAYRSGYILNSSPIAIEREIASARISKKSAILTIGSGHLGQIVSYIERGEINLPPLMSRGKEYPGLQVKLDLKSLGYGVTIIKPLSIV